METVVCEKCGLRAPRNIPADEIMTGQWDGRMPTCDEQLVASVMGS